MCGLGARWQGKLSILDFVTMSFGIVLVRFAIFLVPGRLVRTVAERLVFGKSAHANPDRLLLRFDFQRSLVRFYDSTHALKLWGRKTVAKRQVLPGFTSSTQDSFSSGKTSLVGANSSGRSRLPVVMSISLGRLSIS